MYKIAVGDHGNFLTKNPCQKDDCSRDMYCKRSASVVD